MNRNSINTAPKAIRNDSLAELFTFNSPYSYAFNNPVNWSDPSGLAPEKAGHKDKILEMEEAMIVDGKRTFRNIDVTATRIYEGANIRCWAGDIRQEGLGILLEIQTDKENISYKLGQTAAQIRANLALDKAGNTALIRLEAGYDSPGPNPNSEIKGNSNGAGCGGSGNISIDKPMNYISGNRTSNVVSDNTQVNVDQFSPEYYERSQLQQPSPKDLWNSPIGRYFIPDFLGIGIGFNCISGGGIGGTVELRWVTRGDDASAIPVVTVTPAIGGGGALDFTLNIETAHYFGPVEEIKGSMVETNSITSNAEPTFFISAGVALYGGSVGGTLNITPVNGTYIIGRELNIGPAVPTVIEVAAGHNNTFIIYDFKD